jgi:hypothetical protein
MTAFQNVENIEVVGEVPISAFPWLDRAALGDVRRAQLYRMRGQLECMVRERPWQDCFLRTLNGVQECIDSTLPLPRRADGPALER